MTSTMFLLAGSELNELHKTLKDEAGTTITLEYKKACHRLRKFFNPKRNRGVEVFKFRELVQRSDEKICH